MVFQNLIGLELFDMFLRPLVVWDDNVALRELAGALLEDLVVLEL